MFLAVILSRRQGRAEPTSRVEGAQCVRSDEGVLDDRRQLVDEQELPVSGYTAPKCEAVPARPERRQPSKSLVGVQAEQHVPPGPSHPNTCGRKGAKRVADAFDEGAARNRIGRSLEHACLRSPSEYQLRQRLAKFGAAHFVSPRKRQAADYLSSQPKSMRLVAARPTAAIESTRGMPFGQTSTQFWAFPHPSTPPAPMTASSRSSACILPLG